MPTQLGDGYSGRPEMKGDRQDLTVRGAKATAFSPAGAGWTVLTWAENNTGVRVAIRGKFAISEAVKIAESLK